VRSGSVPPPSRFRPAARAAAGALAVVLALASVALGAPRSAAHSPSSPTRSPFSLGHLIALRSYSDLAWSPDGRRLAYVVSDPDTAESVTNTDVWLADLARGDTWRLTRHSKADVSPTFSRSGDTLAFVGARGEEGRAGIRMLSLRGGEAWAFGSYDESVGEVQWSPDGRLLAFVKTDTLPRAAREWRRRKWDQAVEDERLQYPHLWVADVATGRAWRVVGGEHYVWNVRWSPDSRRLAFLVSPTGAANDEGLTDIGVVPAAGGAMRTLGVVGGRFAWSPDGRWIAWSGRTHRDVAVEKEDVWVCAADGGRPMALTSTFDEDGQTPAWNAGSDTLFFHAQLGASTSLVAVPRAGGLARLLNDRQGAAGFPVTHASGRAVWIESHPDRPNEIVVADHPALTGRALTSLNADVARLGLGATRTVRWTSTDGVPVEGVLVRPPGAAERAALPTLVQLHGGPYASRFDLGFQPTAQYLAAAGYQVFMPNFRSSGGYGTAFMVRKRADWGGQDWRDVESGVDTLVARGLADPHRLGVFGGSYGGYLTAWAITQTDRFKAACVNRGISDLAGLWGQSDVRDYRAFEFQGRPWETFSAFRDRSPLAHIARARTPTLILVGENDRRTPIAQSTELYRSLQALGVPTQLVRYPREGHGLREPHHRADEHARMRAWFDRWLR
jgi:dipeptidyl aminopeptidase/acylaminoacyl peptidase